MYCPHCGKEVADGLKFCTNCGTAINGTVSLARKTIKIKCKTCGGTMDLDEDRPVMVCPFCGSKELIVENDAVAIERIRNKTIKDVEIHRTEVMHDVELGRLQIEQDKLKAVQAEADKAEAAAFRKSKTAITIIVFAILFVFGIILAFPYGHILAGIIAILQIALLVLAWLMGNKTIKSVPGLPLLLVVLSGLLMIPYIQFGA